MPVVPSSRRAFASLRSSMTSVVLCMATVWHAGSKSYIRYGITAHGHAEVDDGLGREALPHRRAPRGGPSRMSSPEVDDEATACPICCRRSAAVACHQRRPGGCTTESFVAT